MKRLRILENIEYQRLLNVASAILVLWARSETIGYARGTGKALKFEVYQPMAGTKFGFRIFAELALEIMPSGLRPKPGPPDPDFY
jgi:hypothetical protein